MGSLGKARDNTATKPDKLTKINPISAILGALVQRLLSFIIVIALVIFNIKA